MRRMMGQSMRGRKKREFLYSESSRNSMAKRMICSDRRSKLHWKSTRFSIPMRCLYQSPASAPSRKFSVANAPAKERNDYSTQIKPSNSVRLVQVYQYADESQ